MKRNLAALFVLATIVLVGCIGGEPTPLPPSSDQAAEVDNTASAPAQPAPATPPPMVQKKAKKGVGRKGRSYGGGIISTPVSAYFSSIERLTFDRVLHDMKTYEALHGRPPKTQEEFMEKIVKAGGLELPLLPAGERYVYNPSKVDLRHNETGLMVEHPAEQ